MARKNLASQGFRKLAEELVENLDEAGEWSEAVRNELVTSFVRQWVTYDGNATFFRSREVQLYFVLGKTALGQPRVISEAIPARCLNWLTLDWKVDPDELPGIIEQLNRGQSAEFTNDEGIPLRLSVNPKERTQVIEPLDETKLPSQNKRDDHKLAVRVLTQELQGLDSHLIDKAATGVVKQWHEFQGHACLFLNAHDQLAFQLVEQGDGACVVHTDRFRVDLVPLLARLGLPPEFLEDVLMFFNMGQRIEVDHPNGGHSILWHDPQERQIHFDSPDITEHPAVPPFLCPKCQAVLPAWEEGQHDQICSLCGNTISMS